MRVMLLSTEWPRSKDLNLLIPVGYKINCALLLMSFQKFLVASPKQRGVTVA